MTEANRMTFDAAAPELSTGHREVDRAFRIALGDLLGNVKPYRAGLLPEARPCLMAGLDYPSPWTRDCAINVWNAGAMVIPGVSKNTLLSVLEERGGRVRIGGQYWDAIVWACGAWHYAVCTGDRGFLGLAFRAVRDSLAALEQEEFDPADGLFRGPACYGDGVASYPDRYTNPDGDSCILDWTCHYPGRKAPRGYGLPMKALSTNCLYLRAWELLGAMASALGRRRDPAWGANAAALRNAINRSFHDPATGRYRYLVDAEGGCDRQEGLGHAFAVLFGIADAGRVPGLIARVESTPHGIACVEPTYERYHLDAQSFGRHAGTIWPQVNAFWAEAAARNRRHDIAWHELEMLAAKACRDVQFVEIYHPLSGLPYGGLQEYNPRQKFDQMADAPGAPLIREWTSCRRQSWCASGYLRMVLTVLFGLRVGPKGIAFEPWLPEGMPHAELRGLRYRRGTLNLRVEGCGGRVTRFEVNGRPRAAPSVPAAPGPGQRDVRIVLSAQEKQSRRAG